LRRADSQSYQFVSGDQPFVSVGDDILRSHLAGRASGNAADFPVGVYPMLPDETCWFLAADFDTKSWMKDVAAFRDTALAKNVPVVDHGETPAGQLGRTDEVAADIFASLGISK
jgi:hypothetical protein